MFHRLTDGIFAIADAAGLSQFPEFVQQYTQQLGGRLDQALIQEGRIAEAAARHGMNPEEYAAHLNSNPNPVVQTEGGIVSANLEDTDQLQAAYDALAHAGPIDLPLMFARFFDGSIANVTLEQFAPAVPISLESVIYASLGMVIGLMLLAGGERGSKGAGRFIGKRLKRRAT